MDAFVRADSAYLPKLEYVTIVEYMGSSDKHNAAEIRGAKALMSSRDAYVDTAVGYVEVKRSQSTCIVRAKVVPEHKVTAKQYVVMATIREDNESIMDTSCDGCAASAGGCKHTLVLLFWLAKRTSEPPSTSIDCYWKKPKLSGVKTEPIRSEEIFPKSKKIRLSPKKSETRLKFLEECRKHNISNSLATSFSIPKQSFNIFDMTVQYVQTGTDNFDNYMSYLSAKLTREVIADIESQTKEQVHSKLWHSMRQGRVTASKIYEASNCNTDGTLVQQILGGYKVPETEAIKRGKRLEKEVIEEVEKTLNAKIEKSGFILINPLVGASPDGVAEDFVVEVKCPISETTQKNYVTKNGKVANKYIAQIQTQMHAANKQKGVFCIADPKFEQNRKIYLYWIDYDSKIVNNLIDKAIIFWRTFIFSKVMLSAKI